jgi:hypothetical protein
LPRASSWKRTGGSAPLGSRNALCKVKVMVEHVHTPTPTPGEWTAPQGRTRGRASFGRRGSPSRDRVVTIEASGRGMLRP